MQQLELTDLAAQFEAAFTALGGKFYRARGLAYAAEQIGLIIANAKAKSAVSWDVPLLREARIEPALARHGIALTWADRSDDPASRLQLREKALAVEFGITTADFVLADTGSLVVLGKPRQPRAVSLAPPRHIALVRPEDFVANLDEFFARLRTKGPNVVETMSSSMTFITGTSRTSDIEKILFKGIHGPLEVHVVYLEEA